MFVKIIGLSPSSNFINVSLRIENTSLESVCLTTCVVKSRIYDAYDIFFFFINFLLYFGNLINFFYKVFTFNI